MKRALLLLATAACTDPAIEMHLVLPQGAPAVDLSCVTAVRFHALGKDQGDANHAADVTNDCVDFSRPPSDLADLASLMQGKFTAAIPPSGLAGVALEAIGGPCSDDLSPYEAMAYGGAPYTSNNLAVPLEPNISCTATASYTVHPLDLLNAGACTAYTTGYVEGADIRPAMLGSISPVMIADYGKSIAMLTNGTGRVASYNAIAGAGCIAAAYYDNANMNYGFTCVSTTAPTLCGGGPGTVEVGVLPDVYYTYYDKTLAQQYDAPTFGTVWDIPTKTAITGATVTIDAGSEGQVVYAEPGSGGLTTHAAPTGASGFFMVYGKGAVAITVSAPGHASEHYIVAGNSDDNSSVIAALPPM